MVVPESEMLSHGHIEVESPIPGSEQQAKAHGFPPIGRQSSIYSLTLDEFQHTLCENGKNFGSMNMDEFLNSIWTAEENQAVNAAAAATGPTSSNNPVGHIPEQHGLTRQGSLTLPPPLCQKTVDEVWSEIRWNQQKQKQLPASSTVHSSGSAPRQPTFGEMTLEDFLIKAGVVREQALATQPQQHQSPIQPLQHVRQPQFGMYQSNAIPGLTFASRPPPLMGISGPAPTTYQPLPLSVGESSGYVANGKRSQPVSYGGRVGYGPSSQSISIDTAVSPISSDGMGTAQVDNVGNHYAVEMGVPRGSRKRTSDGPVEKVVERRQRRMIKNRESAARSRARKQAYTVELEAELNQLREENAQLKQALAELEMKKKQQCAEEEKTRLLSKAERAVEKLRMMRRTLSSHV